MDAQIGANLQTNLEATVTHEPGAAQPILVDTNAAAVAICVKPALVRLWASRGKLAAVGNDKRGRCLYDLRAVRVVAESTRKY